MADLLQRLYKRRRNGSAAAVASASFLLLLLVLLSVALSQPTGRGVLYSSGSDGGGQRTSSCQEEELQSLEGRDERCRYLRSRPPCAPTGYVDYLVLFYCGGLGPPWLGGTALALWLVVLFYLLGDTASQYFCASLEGLSAALRLPPAVAGVTLLSLGNGAPDVISSVVAFASAGGGGGGDAGDVGLSSVLGGALFVSTVVAGVVAVVSARRGGVEAVIERRGFVRDACFLLVAVCYLLAVLVTGTVTVWSAASFLTLYAAYVLLVWTSHCCSAPSAAAQPEPDNKGKPSSDVLAAPLLLPVVSSKPTPTSPPRTFFRRLLAALHSPLYLPRRLTIPDIAAHRWSKPYAVSSALLSPLLLASIFFPTVPTVILAGTLTGALLAVAAASTTDASAPPHGRYSRLTWLAGGFLMSMLWSYLLARELVALLVSTGIIAGVPASVLGVTVLAWGNSLGDLVADVAMAMHDDGGAQTAVAGCHAGPAFNMVVGLGLSLALAAGARYPEPYAVPVETSTYVTLGFLAAAVMWALVVLPARGMRLDGVLGVGLLVIYLCFLCLRVSDAIGFLRLDLLLATTIIPT